MLLMLRNTALQSHQNSGLHCLRTTGQAVANLADSPETTWLDQESCRNLATVVRESLEEAMREEADLAVVLTAENSTSS